MNACKSKTFFTEVEKILKGGLDSVKTQIISMKVDLRCKRKTLLGVVNKLLKTSPSNVLNYYLK